VLTSLADGAIVAEKFGDSPPSVIALHGWGRTGHDFDRVLPGFNAVAVHLRGFGPAAAPDTAWTTTDYADWVAQGIHPDHPAVVVGHSFGGRVAIKLAVNHPSLVRSLVLTGVPFGKKAPTKKPPRSLRLAKTLASMGLVSPSRVETLRRRFGSADYVAATGVMREVLVKAVNEEYFDDLPSINQPVSLVWGENDQPAPLFLATRAHELLPGSNLQVVSGSGHLLDASLEDALRQAITTALGGQLEADR